MKPYVICHMNSSVDGRILGSRWRPVENRMARLFERLHEQLGGGSWLIGRVTGSEYAKAEAYPDRTGQTYPREPWVVRRDAAAPGTASGRRRTTVARTRKGASSDSREVAMPPPPRMVTSWSYRLVPLAGPHEVAVSRSGR